MENIKIFAFVILYDIKYQIKNDKSRTYTYAGICYAQLGQYENAVKYLNNKYAPNVPVSEYTPTDARI